MTYFDENCVFSIFLCHFLMMKEICKESSDPNYYFFIQIVVKQEQMKKMLFGKKRKSFL